jgi:hypothetical protein
VLVTKISEAEHPRFWICSQVDFVVMGIQLVLLTGMVTAPIAQELLPGQLLE